jgi:hypothetical protein
MEELKEFCLIQQTPFHQLDELFLDFVVVKISKILKNFSLFDKITVIPMTWKRPAEDVRVFNAVFVDDF